MLSTGKNLFHFFPPMKTDISDILNKLSSLSVATIPPIHPSGAGQGSLNDLQTEVLFHTGIRSTHWAFGNSHPRANESGAGYGGWDLWLWWLELRGVLESSLQALEQPRSCNFPGGGGGAYGYNQFGVRKFPPTVQLERRGVIVVGIPALDHPRSWPPIMSNILPQPFGPASNSSCSEAPEDPSAAVWQGPASVSLAPKVARLWPRPHIIWATPSFARTLSQRTSVSQIFRCKSDRVVVSESLP